MLKPLAAHDLDALFAPLAPFSRIGIAVSGGADSLALMLMLARWAGPERQLVVYTVDHGLREAAAAECQFVVETAHNLGLAARMLKWSAQKPQSGMQAAARAARYQLIGSAMAADDVQILATGHHLDDQAETILMRLAHGSGLSGLSGIAAISQIDEILLCRPLLGLSHRDLVTIVADAGLTPIEDPSNANADYERVRWRQALPQLAQTGLSADRLGQFAARVGRADKALQTLTNESIAHLVTVDGLGQLELSKAEFIKLDLEIRLRVLQQILAVAGGWSKPYGLGPVEELSENISKTSFKATTLHGAIIACQNGIISLTREPARVPAETVILPPGGQVVWDRRFVVSNPAHVPITITSAHHITRQTLADLIGGAYKGPMSAARTAPLFKTQDDGTLGIGTYIDTKCVEVRFCGLTRT